MEFKKDDENYIYQIIGKNIKKYRKLRGWTQEKLAEEIDYSLSFISGIESTYHQTFSLVLYGAYQEYLVLTSINYVRMKAKITQILNTSTINVIYVALKQKYQ